MAAAAVATIVVVLAVVYVAGAVAFHFFFMPNTTLDGRDVSLRLASDESSTYASKVGTYQAQVVGDGLSFTVRGSDIGLSFDETAYEKGTIDQQDPWTWPLTILSKHELAAQGGASFDTQKLASYVRPIVEEFNKTATQPQNATIAFDDATQQFAVKPEVAGNAIDADALLSELESAFDGMPARVVPTDAALLKPAVTSTDASLQQAVQNANRFMASDIKLTLGGKDAGSITRAQIASWIMLGDDNSATLDHDKVAQWAATDIAKKYDTVTKTRTYTRPDGKQVTVEDQGHGNYGWTTDEASLVSAVTDTIESGSGTSVDIPTKQNAGAVPDAGARDWGKRYIDVDLTEQHARMYDDAGNLVWESDIVTGNHSKGQDTPTGVYAMNDYRSSGDVELRGKVDPATGEPEYISHVSIWMPFIGNSYALHDADWRSSFGGTIYETNGSHGCVNLPPDKAKELFGMCQVGDVVVVHY